jgi:hypothetical protein
VAIQDYEPLDLSRFYNVSIQFQNSGAQKLIGIQSLRGLPFWIGSPEMESSCCFIGFDPSRNAPNTIRIPLAAKAQNVIFAHALLESYLLDGSMVGQQIASYRFFFENGPIIEVPIRERFEIGVVPSNWGQLPFVAVPDSNDWLYPKDIRQTSQGGRAQTETGGGAARAYYLWCWQNPYPEMRLEAMEIDSGHQKFLIAGITLGHAVENPLVPLARRTVKITLLDAEAARQPFNLEVNADRGVATYVYALPQDSPIDFMASPMPGWGEAQNLTSSPAYVEIAAVPSATISVKSNGELLDQVRWSDLKSVNPSARPRLNLEVIDPGLNWVKVTVLDSDTNRPVPCRIHFRSPEGIPYQPHGHHAHVNSNLDSWHVDLGGDVRLGQISYAYIDGRCQGWLPRGEVMVDIARGFEYEPIRTRIQIEPGQQTLTLSIKRLIDMKRQRWFSGDSHVHFLGTQGALFEAQGEDLNVVSLLQSQWGHLFTNIEDFTGKAGLTANGNTIVYCSQENRQHLLGHLNLLGLKEPVYPFCSDGAEEAEIGGILQTNLSAWADQTHAQGGLTIIPHFPIPNGEHAALIATGRADAIEMTRHSNYSHFEYYRYLNGGYRLPLVGGTDKMDSSVPVGLYRTYAYIPEDQPFTYETWCQAVRMGHTFLSGGPMLRFSVNGACMGDTMQLPAGGGTVEIDAEVQSIFPIHTLEIVQQGKVVASTEELKGARHLRLRTSLKIDRSTWLAARCGGPNQTPSLHFDTWARGIFAHSSPIYIAVGEPYQIFNPNTAQYMLTLMEGTLAHLRQAAIVYPPEKVTHHHGESDHQSFLERPILEGIQAVHQRMHQSGLPHS